MKECLKSMGEMLSLFDALLRPFHHQAKGKPVAKPLSRALSSVDLLFYRLLNRHP